MELVGEVISFLVGATGVGDLVVFVVVMVVGVGVNVVWMTVVRGVDVADLTTEGMFLTKVEAEVIVEAQKESEHGIIVAVAEVVVEAGVGAGIVVEAEVAAGLVAEVEAEAEAEAVPAAGAGAGVMIGGIGQFNSFLIERILGHTKWELLKQEIFPCLLVLANRRIPLWEVSKGSSNLLLLALIQGIQKL